MGVLLVLVVLALVVGVLRALDAEYRGERYRVSPWLRRHAHRQA